MTHMTITAYSDKTLCSQFVFQLLRDDKQDTTTSLRNITCPDCIVAVKDIIRKLENKGVSSTTSNNIGEEK